MANGKKPIPKTQKQLSNELSNPNIPISVNERGNQLSFKNDTTKPISIGFQDIDESISYYLQNVIKPTVFQNDEIIKVPVIYGSPEKWKSYQKDGYYRDDNGKTMLPLFMFKRENIEKIRTINNKLDANLPHNFTVVSKTYTPKNAYSNFNLLNNRVPQKTYYATVVPDYVNITYVCAFQTYYISQLNKLIEAIEYASDSYWGDPERFKFKVSIDGFSQITEMEQDNERSVKCTFNMKLFGYIIPDTIEKDLTFISKFNDKSKVIILTETDKPI